MRTRTLSMIALCLSLAASAWSQSTGSISGHVTDESGGSVAGVEVVASWNDSKRTTSTDARGSYSLTALAPATYVVSFGKKGFSPNANSVTVLAGSTATLDAQLSLAPVEENVTVESEQPISTDPQNNANALVIRGADLEALPDDPDELAEALQALAGPSAGPNGGQLFIDGFTSGRLPSKESIREIRINANPFSAEYDRLGQGRIEIFTKPGSDQWRASGSFSFNDETLNSRNPFATNRPPYQRREWNLNLSGPLASKKASFSLEFEGRSVDDNDVVNATILDTTLTPTPVRLALLNPQTRTNVSPRIEYQINSSNTLVTRYRHSGSDRTGGVGEFSLPSRAYDSRTKGHEVQVTETAVIHQRIVNETRLQYGWDRRDQNGDNSIPALRVSEAFTGGGPQVGRSFNRNQDWELSNSTSWSQGKHSLKSGFHLQAESVNDVSRQNFGGTLTFAGGGVGPELDANGNVVRDASGQPIVSPITSLERYRRTILFQRQGLSPDDVRARGGGPSQFTIAGGHPEASVSQWELAAFLQDDWRVHTSLTLSAGLRLETQNNIDRHVDLAPRVAFAWMPGATGDRRPHSVVRGGIGVFYDRVSQDLTLQATRFDGVNQQQFLVTDPDMLSRIRFDVDRISALPSVETLASFELPQTTRRLADDLRAPYTIQSSLSFERQLPRNFTLSVTGFSAQSRRLLRSRNVNAPLPGTNERPRPGNGNVYQYESTGRMNQNQAIISLSNRTSRTFSLFAHYFIGRAKSDTDGAGTFPMNQYDTSGEYGRASSDVRHRLFVGASVTGPWGTRLSPFVLLSSGRPFNITTGRDNNGDTLFTDRPGVAQDPTRPSVVVTRFGTFDLNPQPGQPLIPRNSGSGPGFAVVNLRLTKTIGFGRKEEAAIPPDSGGRFPGPGGRGGEGDRGGDRGGDSRGSRSSDRFLQSGHRYNTTFSLQVQNLFNHTNAGTPIGNLSSPQFGQSNASAPGFSSSTAGNRRVEFQVRFGF